jgi:hypothetical protein
MGVTERESLAEASGSHSTATISWCAGHLYSGGELGHRSRRVRARCPKGRWPGPAVPGCGVSAGAFTRVACRAAGAFRRAARRAAGAFTRVALGAARPAPWRGERRLPRRKGRFSGVPSLGFSPANAKAVRDKRAHARSRSAGAGLLGPRPQASGPEGNAPEGACGPEGNARERAWLGAELPGERPRGQRAAPRPPRCPSSPPASIEVGI